MNASEEYAIKKIAKGGLIIFTGMILSSLTFLLYRILAARYLSPSDYGLLSMGIVFLNIGALFGLVGIHHSIGKFINHYLAIKRFDRVKGIIILSFCITIPSSIIIFLALYYSSQSLALNIFKIEELAPIISIFSFGIPLIVIAQLLKFYFFTFKKPEYSIVSETIFEKFFNLLLLLFAISISASLLFLSWMYITSLLISLIVASILLGKILLKNMPVIFKKEINPVFDVKQLLSFSIPLMIVGILDIALGWTDIIMIGVFRSSLEVGFYNTAYVISSAFLIIWIAIGDMFYPIISELYAKKQKTSIRKTFEVTSRWIFVLALPLLVFIIVFPSRTLSLVFGHKYLDAAIPLVILTLGYFPLAIFGLSEQGLRTYKKIKFLGVSTLIALVINILLNFLLIPPYGMIGASISTTLSLIFFTIIRFVKFKKILHFSFDLNLYKKYIYSAIISFIAVFSLFKILNLFSTYLFISAILLYMIFYFVLLILFKSFSKEDIAIFEAAERKTGISIPFLKYFLKTNRNK